MNNKKESIGIIRQRGQITIPDEIRKALKWISTDQAVLFIVKDDGEIGIRPYKKKGYDWQKIWSGIRRARSIKGNHGNLSQFIDEDRQRRK